MSPGNAESPTMPPSNGSLLPLVLQAITARIDSLERSTDRRMVEYDRRLQTLEQMTSAGLWTRGDDQDTPTARRGRFKAWLEEAELLNKLLSLWKGGPWSMVGWLLFFAAKWLGVL